MRDDLEVKDFEWGTEETFADNAYFKAKYVFMEPNHEAQITSVAATDTVTFYILGGALIVTCFEPGTPKEKATALFTGTRFEVPSNTQYYVGTGTEQSAEFIEVRRGSY